jgi:hypothetical protein
MPGGLQRARASEHRRLDRFGTLSAPQWEHQTHHTPCTVSIDHETTYLKNHRSAAVQSIYLRSLEGYDHDRSPAVLSTYDRWMTTSMRKMRKDLGRIPVVVVESHHHGTPTVLDMCASLCIASHS